LIQLLQTIRIRMKPWSNCSSTMQCLLTVQRSVLTFFLVLYA
jgi:hypothetical protein